MNADRKHATDPIPELEPLDRFISLREAAHQIGTSTMWLYNRRGQLPFLVRFPLDEDPVKAPVRVSVQKLKAWMESAAVVPAKPRRKGRKG